MNSDFLDGTGLIFVRMSYENDEIICTQKDEKFDIKISEMSEFLERGGWLKDYDKAVKTKKNQVGTEKLINERWVSLQINPKQDYIAIILKDVTKHKSAQIVLWRGFIRDGLKLSREIAMPLSAVTTVLVGLGFFINHQSAKERAKDLRLAKEIKETREIWLKDVKDQDSVQKLNLEITLEMIHELKKQNKTNKLQTELTQLYKLSEEENIGHKTYIGLVNYLHSDKEYDKSVTKIYEYAKKLEEIKDSVKNDHKKHVKRKRKEF